MFQVNLRPLWLHAVTTDHNKPRIKGLMRGTIQTVDCRTLRSLVVPLPLYFRRILVASACAAGFGASAALAAVDAGKVEVIPALKGMSPSEQAAAILRLDTQWHTLPVEERRKTADSLRMKLAELTPEQRQQMRDQIREHLRSLPPEGRDRLRGEWQEHSPEERQRVREEMRVRFERMSPDERDRLRETLRERRFNDARGEGPGTLRR